jgi:hypothetical protein
MPTSKKFYISNRFLQDQLAVLIGGILIPSIFGWYFSPWFYCLSFLGILLTLRSFSYHLFINEGFVEEKGLFIKGRIISISEIKEAIINFYQYIAPGGVDRYGQHTPPPIFGFSLKTDDNFSKPFPLYPINPKFIDELKKVNPSIIVTNQQIIKDWHSEDRKKFKKNYNLFWTIFFIGVAIWLILKILYPQSF